MTTSNSGESVLCVDCGTTNDARASTCWLCGQILGPSTTVRVPQGPSTVPAGAVDWTSAGIVAALIVVGAGLGAVQPGLLIPYALIATPALISMFVKSHRQREQGHPMTPAEKVLKFIVSAAMVMGMLAGITVAIVIAGAMVLFAICFFNGAPSFH